MKTRATRQLATTYDVVAAGRDHPTARQVFERVRGQMPQVSLGTVYRNLEKLRQQGRLRVVRLDAGVAHYDAMVEPHDHFVCESCGAVTDLARDPARAEGGPRVADGCLVRWQTTAVYGTCRPCRDAEPATVASR